MLDIKENKQLKKDVVDCIKYLDLKDLNIENIIEYIDYTNKMRYSEKEVIRVLLEIIKQDCNVPDWEF
ncbi:MAG: hypothetical protein Q4B43_11030 [Bacteroidota bacterium]|nr:hypothetical protein [Bacteroidota bacterium]